MNLEIIKRFAPILPLAAKSASDLTDPEWELVATTLGGPGAQDGLFPFLKKLARLHPGTEVLSLLGSPEASKALAQMKQSTAKRENTLMVACKFCGRHYEDEIQ